MFFFLGGGNENVSQVRAFGRYKSDIKHMQMVVAY